MLTFLFHGPSGSGKDTQVNILVDKYGFLNIGTGQMFRTMYEEGDPRAVEAHKYWSVGNFVPYDITYDMFADWLNLEENIAVERLSGRTICSNCKEPYHPKWKREKKKGVCDKCGGKLVTREDDMPEKIVERLKEYKKTIDPIIKEYKKRGIFIEIDASQSIEEVHKELVEKLNL
jgi:adenylate kinase